MTKFYLSIFGWRTLTSQFNICRKLLHLQCCFLSTTFNVLEDLEEKVSFACFVILKEVCLFFSSIFTNDPTTCCHFIYEQLIYLSKHLALHDFPQQNWFSFWIYLTFLFPVISSNHENILLLLFTHFFLWKPMNFHKAKEENPKENYHNNEQSGGNPTFYWH